METDINCKIMKNLAQYLKQNFNKQEIVSILNEINFFAPSVVKILEDTNNLVLYKDLDNYLFNINEKQSGRKENGVYYTETDITNFILEKCILCKNETMYLDSSVFDPTCGSGEFILTALKQKIEINNKKTEKKKLIEIIKTIYGNDINIDSVFVTRLRLFLYILNKTDVQNIKGIGKILQSNITCKDFFKYNTNKKFDFIIGNPPYVENKLNYGNMYADILDKVCYISSKESVIGFIIPLSYIATPRMSKIRDRVSDTFQTQYLYNFSDRPACLFTQVHQKLSIIIAKKSEKRFLFTGNYQYWYKNERCSLLKNQIAVENPYATKDFIPKLGNEIDKSIYKKIVTQTISINSFFLDEKKEFIENKHCLYLNMRAAFWIKTFLNKHTGNEYKKIYFENEKQCHYIYCLFNSSLFWWFWICISDCWHITKKELNNFRIPIIYDPKLVIQLAQNLEKKLEETKIYIGTKQTDFAYKHKLCIEEIHAIDDYINLLFNLSETESDYVKKFALNYRMSEGVKRECN